MKTHTHNRNHRLFVNIDINSSITRYFANVAAKEPAAVEEADFYPFVDAYAGTDVTDILICNFCQFSQTPSNVWSDFAFKAHQKVENGVAVDYTNWYGANALFHEKYGIDPYEIWFRRIRENGQRAWMTMRMNDCHEPDDDASFLRSEFFYEAKEKGFMIGSEYGYFRNCFNYAVPEVREKMLAYIREQLRRYDVDGIEFDFEREITCFDYLRDPDCHKIMTAFLREARALVRECAGKWGHPIKVGIRLGRDIAQNKTFGFDVEAIVREDLVDLICVTPRWESCDSGMPIAEWVERFPEVEIVAGIEILVNQKYFWGTGMEDCNYTTPEVVRGYAADYFAQGSDGIYLFNHFFPENVEHDAVIYRTCGTPEIAAALPRRHVVTYQDVAPVGYARWEPLPLSANGKRFEIRLGSPAQNGQGVALVVGIDPGDEIARLRVTVNGTAIDPAAFAPTKIGQEENAFYAKPDAKMYAARLPAAAFEGRDKLELEFGTCAYENEKYVTVNYIEADVG